MTSIRTVWLRAAAAPAIVLLAGGCDTRTPLERVNDLVTQWEAAAATVLPAAARAESERVTALYGAADIECGRTSVSARGPPRALSSGCRTVAEMEGGSCSTGTYGWQRR